MPLVLHYHPLSSYCWKALIAVDVLGVALERRMLDLGDPGELAAFRALWPMGKMPVLVDGDRVVAETSILVEYLGLHHAAQPGVLIPQDPVRALDVRFWDRFCDLHVMTTMQVLTVDRMTPPEARDGGAVERARESLRTAYGVLDARLAGRTWLADDRFSLADCAAAPSLFYAATYVPFGDDQPHLAAYLERLLAHPAVAQVLADAMPFFQWFPNRDALPERFRDAEWE